MPASAALLLMLLPRGQPPKPHQKSKALMGWLRIWGGWVCSPGGDEEEWSRGEEGEEGGEEQAFGAEEAAERHQAQ